MHLRNQKIYRHFANVSLVVI